MLGFLLLALCGVVSGVLGGMGMGGGTVLIPMLAVFFGAGAHACATVNLISFIPTAVVSLVIHFRNGLIEKKGLWLIVLPAAASAVGAYFLSRLVDPSVLIRIFGIFLILLAIRSVLTIVTSKTKKHKN